MNSPMLDSTFFFTDQECQQILNSFCGALPAKITAHEVDHGDNDDNPAVDTDIFSTFNFNSALYDTIDHEQPRGEHSEAPFAYETLPDSMPMSEHSSDWFSLGSFPPTSTTTSDDLLAFDTGVWELPTLQPAATLPESIIQAPFDMITPETKDDSPTKKPKFVRPTMSPSMRRHTDSILPTSARNEMVEATPSAQSSNSLRQQRNHYAIEKRYRTNLNEKLRELGEVVPDVIPDVSTDVPMEAFDAAELKNSAQSSTTVTQSSTQSSYGSLPSHPAASNAANSKRSARKSHVLDRTLSYIRYLETRIQHSETKLDSMKNSVKLSLDVLIRGSQTAGVPGMNNSTLVQQSLDKGILSASEVQEGAQDSDYTSDTTKHRQNQDCS